MQPINGAEPKSEFSQSNILEKLIPTMSIGANIVQNGICYMLSMEWIYQAVLSHDESRVPETFIPYDFKELTMIYYKQIANNFIAYAMAITKRRGEAPADFMRDVIDLSNVNDSLGIDDLFCRLCTVGKYKAKTFESCNSGDQMDKIFQKESVIYLVSLYFKLPAWESKKFAGHKVAVCKWEENIMFFDPNFGVYKITDFNAFFESLREIYTEAKIFVTTVVANKNENF